MINIVLHEPRIPQNTGNIGRLCLALNARLHLIHPLGFVLSDRALKRAGMDYFAQVELVEWERLGAFLAENALNPTHFLLSTKAQKSYFTARFGAECYLHFGREDRGLPENLLAAHPNRAFRIPMENDARSLNLANAVAIVAYEAYRQNLLGDLR